MEYPYKNLNKLTLPTLLNYAVEHYATRKLFGNVGEEPFTYKDFKQKIQELIEILQAYNVKKGDKVVLLSENMPHWSVAYFAVTYFGAVIVPILPDFTEKDIHNIIDHSESNVVIVSEKYLQIIEKFHKKLHLVIDLNLLEPLKYLSNNNILSHISISEKYNVEEDDLATILYTSGTTGHSKGVMLSHKNLVANATSAYNHIDFKYDDVWLSILPLAHTFECTVGMLIPILHGASVFYIQKTPTPSVLLETFQIVQPTMMLSVPLIMEKIYKNKILPKFTKSPLLSFLYKIAPIRKQLNKLAGKKLKQTFGGKIRFVGLGGAATAPFVEQFLIEAKFPFIVGYGLTETSPLLSGSILGEKTKFRSCGTAVANTTLAIHNPDPLTGEGEIIAKSPSIMLGYYKDKKQTDEVIRDGWFFTGDLGYLDQDGYLYIRGRNKNVIIGSSGENIYPEQIESIINQNSIVIDSLVMESNNQLIAKVNLDYDQIDQNADIPILLENLRKHVNNNVAHFSKIVKFIEEKEPFIKTPTKKIKRYLYTQTSK